EAVLRKRAAEAADFGFLFKDDRIVFGEMIAGARARKPAANNDDSLLAHERISTFIRRYAERQAKQTVPLIVTTAHSNVTWLISRATVLKSAPRMYVVIAVSRTESFRRRRRSAKWSGLPFMTGIPLRHRIHITSVRSNSGMPRIKTGLTTAS